MALFNLIFRPDMGFSLICHTNKPTFDLFFNSIRNHPSENPAKGKLMLINIFYYLGKET
ncbi:hypothetical protein EV198_1005 [Roseivirga ehrenbergii]|nr:hypothetical protein EV198_1005 [Roseivirga ehrenbergii]